MQVFLELSDRPSLTGIRSQASGSLSSSVRFVRSEAGDLIRSRQHCHVSFHLMKTARIAMRERGSRYHRVSIVTRRPIGRDFSNHFVLATFSSGTVMSTRLVFLLTTLFRSVRRFLHRSMVTRAVRSISLDSPGRSLVTVMRIESTKSRDSLRSKWVREPEGTTQHTPPCKCSIALEESHSRSK